jgi:hypothetical protein
MVNLARGAVPASTFDVWRLHTIATRDACAFPVCAADAQADPSAAIDSRRAICGVRIVCPPHEVLKHFSGVPVLVPVALVATIL